MPVRMTKKRAIENADCLFRSHKTRSGEAASLVYYDATGDSKPLQLDDMNNAIACILRGASLAVERGGDWRFYVINICDVWA